MQKKILRFKKLVGRGDFHSLPIQSQVLDSVKSEVGSHEDLAMSDEGKTANSIEKLNTVPNSDITVVIDKPIGSLDILRDDVSNSQVASDGLDECPPGGSGDCGLFDMVLKGVGTPKVNVKLPALAHVDRHDVDGVSTDQSQFNANMIQIYNRVFHSRQYNFKNVRVPIPSGLNIAAWKTYLHDYADSDLIKFLEFGWPSSFNHMAPLISTFDNHKSGTDYASHIDTYLLTELGHSAILGPFASPPVVPLHLSPIMTRPKKESLTRRIVVDLSWPKGYSVNDGIQENNYLGTTIDLRLPTVDFMAERVRHLGPGCYMYKLDLSRGYRQLRLDPLDWPLMSIKHAGSLYMDICPPFGLRTAAMMMQRTNMAVSQIHGDYGYLSRPFIDDFGGAELDCGVATNAFGTLRTILYNVGLDEAEHKACPPSTKMIWLGINVDSVEMTLSIPEQKLVEVKSMVSAWSGHQMANKRQVQSLVGSLNFVSSVAPPVRVYTNRILNFLRSMPNEGSVLIPNEVRADLDFFGRLMPEFNGVTLLDKSLEPSADQLEVDACLTGCGGLSGDEFYSCCFPQFIIKECYPIACLEMLNIVVALRLWASKWKGQKLQVYCDNMIACLALQNGRSKDTFLQSCIRTVFLLAVTNDVEILVCHRPGVDMTAADALSRSHTGDRFRVLLNEIGAMEDRHEVAVSDEYFVVVD